MSQARQAVATTEQRGVSVQESRTARASLRNAWLFDLLFAGTPTVTWAAAGELPAGFERADQFAVLPAGGGRSFMVSLAAPRGASSALTSYNSLRSGRTRLARRVLGLGLRTRLAQALLLDKIDIGIAPGAASAQPAGNLLGEHLRQLFGRGPVVLAFGGGSGPYRKPVLQVFAADGAPLAYIKVGWNDWARAAVRREAAALQACALRPMRLGVPEFVGLSTWRGLDLLITGPLPRGIRGLGHRSSVPDASVLREISELGPGFVGELAASPWWLSVRSRIRAGLADPPARSALELAAERIEQAHGRVPLEFGAWHGDLVPWNLARRGSRLYAWDWESSTPDVPLGFDAVHFLFSVAFIAQGRPLAEAAAMAAGSAGPALRALGLPEQAHHLVAILHLVELAVRHEEARRSTGEVDDRFYPVVTQVLERALAGPRGLAGQRSGGSAA
jgi:hypothetical protein